MKTKTNPSIQQKKQNTPLFSNIRWRPPPSGQVTRGFRMMFKSKRFYQEATLNAEHADKFHLLYFSFWFFQLLLHYIYIYSDRTTINYITYQP